MKSTKCFSPLLTAEVIDTTSTAMAVNADAFNRQLHPNEFHAIQIIAEKLGVNEEELKKAIVTITPRLKASGVS